MEMTWLASALVFLAGFWLVIFALNRRYNLKKRNIEVGPGILMWRTKRGLNFIDKTAKAHKSGWRTFGTAAVIVGFGFMVFMLVNLILNAALVITRPDVAAPGVRLVIPGLTIPLLEGLIAILSVLLVHEFAHGFVLRAQGLPTKSVGAMVFIAIPGAFVEPDEKRLKKAPVMQRLRVYGAGSFANVLLALVCLSVLLVAVAPRPGVYVWAAPENENVPAYNNLLPGTRLYSIAINENAPVTLNEWEDFDNLMKNVRPRDNLTIVTSDNNDNITLTAVTHPDNENRGYLGVVTVSAISRSDFINPLFTLAAISYGIMGYPLFHPYCNDSFLPWPIISLLTWIFLLNFAIGLFNMLPAIPLDGGYILSGIVEKRTSAKTARRVALGFSFFVLALIVVSFLPGLW
jgi:membrane-associated protease RseP (regulator of RpoE activity)